ncbi:MFS transporter [Psittacicella hinzii]|uniref:Major facilitator superfamily (MFS) profile domain-containing protein n=1 Tax=Psittacicella hinzii TaxID=2028575 RepID=A0A3A1YJR7_9GAMM|nr:MFS transporter [Psittacicella hinzii]RIY37821.1 hypothetical protein CKF58_04640 [Psittacicella hinzii]
MNKLISSYFWYTAIGLCLVTLISRAPFTSTSAIINNIAVDYSLNSTQQGLILSLPTFVMALCSLFVAKLDNKIGFVLAIFYAVALIIIGIAIRDFLSILSQNAGIYIIYSGTIILSIGITILSVLYPSFINGFFKQQLGVMNAINGANLSISSLLGTFSSLWLINHGYTWRDVGLLWIIISSLILLYYIPIIFFTREQMQQIRFATQSQQSTLKQDSKQQLEPSTQKQQNNIQQDNKPSEQIALNSKKSTSMWKQWAAWCIAIAFGLESANFYFGISWYRNYAGESLSDAQMAVLVNIFQFFAIISSLIAPIACTKYVKYLGAILLWSAIAFVASTLGLIIFYNYYVILLWLFVLFGITSGVLLAVLLLLLSLKTTRSQDTSRLSSMVNCVGFILTAIFLFGFGWLYDLTGKFDAGIYIMIAYNIFIPLLCYLANKLPIKS